MKLATTADLFWLTVQLSGKGEDVALEGTKGMPRPTTFAEKGNIFANEQRSEWLLRGNVEGPLYQKS